MFLLLVFLVSLPVIVNTLGASVLGMSSWPFLPPILWDLAVGMALMMTTTAPAMDGFDGLGIWSGLGASAVVFLACAAGFIGGCAGSPSGGIKMARFLGLYDFVRGTLTNRRSVRSFRADVPIQYFHMLPLFLLLWLLALIVGVVALFLGGIQLEEAAPAVALSLTNTGLGPSYRGVVDFTLWPDWTHLVLMVLMVLGRFEFVIVASFLSWRYWSNGTIIAGAVR